MKVLIVTTAFYPEQAIGAVRVTKLVKYLDAAGVEVSVVSKKVSDETPKDETLHFEALDGIKWISVDQSPLFSRVFMRARKQIVKGQSALSLMGKAETKPSLKARMMRYLQFGFTLLKGVDWARQVAKQVQSQMPNEIYDVVLSSYPSYGAPLAGNALVKRGVARKHVIDFRDPMAYGDQAAPGLEILNRRLQGRFSGSADAALFISHGVQMMVSRTSKFEQSHILSNGFDPEEARGVKQVPVSPDKLVFCYVGALYGGKRDLSAFFSALNSLIVSGEISAEAVELQYAGKEFAELKAQALAQGVGHILVDRGFVKRQESMDLQRASDICLVSTWNDAQDQGILTGKVFEYLLFRKPVIAVVAGDLPNSEMKKVIETTGAGITIELGSPNLADEAADLRDFIKSAHDQKCASGKLTGTYLDSVEDFGYPRLAAKLHDILKAL